MRRAAVALVTCAAGVTAASRPAAADHRAFTRTYEYATQTAGDTELELETAQSRASFADGSPQSLELRLAVEHGVAERTDVALLHTFLQSTGAGTPQDPGAPLHLDEVRVRARHRFAERGELTVDTLAVVELAKRFGASSYVAEARVVLARDLGRLTVAVNPRATMRFGADVGDGRTPELEAGWAAGATVDVVPALRVGVETWGGLDLEAPDEIAAAVGPAISWTPTPSLWATTTVGVGLDGIERISVRAVIGLRL